MKYAQLFQKKNKNQKPYDNSLILAVLMLISALLEGWRKRKEHRILRKNLIIKDQLKEKNILMKEIHHRVKKNIQIISSLLNIQCRQINDARAIEAINLSRNRVKSMALIHQNLYQKENITNIDAKDYIERLSLSIFHSYKINQENIKLATDVDELDLDVGLTIPLGLIINELVTNALKHAFPENKKGKINIELKQIENSLRLTVSDNGIGMEKEHELKSSFGLKMIRIFAKKLKATYSIENNNGSQITLLINNFKLVG